LCAGSSGRRRSAYAQVSVRPVDPVRDEFLFTASGVDAPYLTVKAAALAALRCSGCAHICVRSITIKWVAVICVGMRPVLGRGRP